MSFEIHQGYYNYNKWTIHNNDCIATLQAIEKNSIDCIVTSPPYFNKRAYGEKGTQQGNRASYTYAKRGKALENEIGWGQNLGEYCENIGKLFCLCHGVLRDGKSMFVNVNKIRNNFSTFDVSHLIITEARKVGFTHRETIIWIKCNTRNVPQNSQPYYLDDGWEYVLLFTKGKGLINRKKYLPIIHKFECEHCNKSNTVEKKIKPNYFYSNIGYTESNYLGSEHPAKFPKNLPYFAFNLCTNKGDTILDPFSGIGTTLVAGLEMGLNVIGCEINSEFCRLAIEEISKLEIE